MPVFRSIVFSAALAGLIVGAVISVAQFLGTVPLIQKSEVYERKAAVPAQPAAQHGAAHDHDNSHGHDSAWEPEQGFQRNAFTVAPPRGDPASSVTEMVHWCIDSVAGCGACAEGCIDTWLSEPVCASISTVAFVDAS